MSLTNKEILDILSQTLDIAIDLRESYKNTQELATGEGTQTEFIDVALSDTKAGLDIASYIPTAITIGTAVKGAVTTGIVPALKAAMATLSSISLGVALPVGAVALAGTAFLAYLDYKFKNNTNWVYESENAAAEYGEAIEALANGYKERGDKIAEGIQEEIEQNKKLVGYVKELFTYLDKDGNIVSNRERAEQLYAVIKSTTPNAISKTEDGRIQMDSTMDTVEKYTAMVNAATVLTADRDNYKATQMEWLQLAPEIYAEEQRFKDAKAKLDAMIKERDALIEQQKIEQLNNEDWDKEKDDRIGELQEKIEFYEKEYNKSADKIQQYKEKAQGMEDYLRAYEGLEEAFQSGDAERINDALGAYNINFSINEEESKEKIKENFQIAESCVESLEAALKRADEQGFSKEFKTDLVEGALQQVQAVAQEMLQFGMEKERVNSMLAEVINKMYELDGAEGHGLKYTNMAIDIFGEQAEEAYLKMIEATAQANEAIKALQAPFNKPTEEVIKDMMDRGYTEAEAEEALLKSVELMNTAKAKVTDGMEEVANKVAEAQAEAEAAGIKIEADIIKQANDAVAEARKIAESGIEQIKDDLGIQSPSRVAAKEIGLPLAQGVGVGFQKGIEAFRRKGSSSVLDSLRTHTQDFSSKQTEAINEIEEKELASMVETARAAVLSFRQDPFGGMRPEVVNGDSFYSSGGGNTYATNYTFNSPRALDYREMRQELRRIDQLNRLTALA